MGTGMSCWVVVVLGSFAAAGCGSASDVASPKAETVPPPASADRPDERAPGSPSSPSTPSPGLAASCADAGEGPPAPSTESELSAWLRTGTYRCWARESAKHPSTGPHGGDVRTYLNASLDGSLAAGAAEHPQGAVAVKELFGNGETLTGWAVMVKNRTASDAGKGWYWYEVFGTAPGSPSIEGQGRSLCTNCHGDGQDYVKVPYPLR